MKELVKYLESLIVTHGAGSGEPLRLLPWQKAFVNGAFSTEGDGALSVGHGNGKTTLTAGIACASLDGPLVRPRAETVIVASSFQQARIGFAHVLAFLGERHDLTNSRHSRFRVQDSSNIAVITDKATGAKVRCIGSDPRRAHGLAPALILADEGAQWPATTSPAMIAALRTSLGKIDGSRLIALGTRPDASDHWFAKMLDGTSGYSQTHAASKDDPPFSKATWRKANPSLKHMPALAKAIEREAKDARRDPAMLAAFSALRLNTGTSDTARSHLLSPASWAEAEGDRDRSGVLIFGVDLGTTGAMSAVAAVWESGRLEALAALPGSPPLDERERADGVPGLYEAMARTGDLLVAPGRTTSPKWLLAQAIGRFGAPETIVTDRWRLGELEDAVSELATGAPIITRGMGFKDGTEDVRRFRTAVLDGKLAPVKSVLLRSAISPVMKSLIDQSVSGATMMTSIAGLPSMFATMAIARAASN